MALVDVGDLLPGFAFTVTSNTTGALTSPASFSVALAAPDGTTPTVTVTSPSTGVYAVAYVAAQAGRYTAVGTATGNGCDGASTLVWDVAATAAGDQPAVSLEQLRTHLRKGSTASDEELRRYALVATELAEEWLGYVIRRQTITAEQHDGGTDAVVLLRMPVQSVTSVLVAGAALASTAYRLDKRAGILRAAAGAFAGGDLDLEVTYVAAPTRGQARYVQGVLEIARHLWDTQRGGSNLPRQQGAEDVWDSGSGWSVPRRVMELLGRRAPGFA